MANSISPWVTDLFKTIDRMDSKGFAESLTADGKFWFANHPPAVGRPAVEGAVSQFFGALGGLSHTLHRAWEQEGSLVVEGEVTYTRKDQRKVTVPFCDTFQLQGRQISEYRIYMDLAPLWAP